MCFLITHARNVTFVEGDMNISIVILKMFMEPVAKTNTFILCSLLGLVIFTVKHELALVLILDGPLTFILGCGWGGYG